MTKADELSNPQSCLNRSADDEPLFVICGRDQLSSDAVRDWAIRFRDMRMDLGTWDATAQEKYKDAVECARRMANWRESHGGGKIPD
jgi:hypothetical protein